MPPNRIALVFHSNDIPLMLNTLANGVWLRTVQVGLFLGLSFSSLAQATLSASQTDQFITRIMDSANVPGLSLAIIRGNKLAYSLYKVVVDGKWMLNPANSVTQKDERGNVNSVLAIR